MKRYKHYMDGINVPDTLHEKLTDLKAPERRPNPWLKWGSLAAALVLVIGAGVWAAGLPAGAWRAAAEPDSESTIPPAITDIISSPDVPAADPSHPDHAAKDPGYPLTSGDTQSYYFLPALRWADVSGLPPNQMAADYALAPPTAIHRSVASGDMPVLCGGEDAMEDHLLWDGLDWGGMLWFLEDGTPQAADLYAEGEELHLSLEIMKGGKVPSCSVLPDEYYERTTWRGVEVTAIRQGPCIIAAADDDTGRAGRYEVSFLSDGAGYKLCVTTANEALAEEMCARFVLYAVDGGLHLNALSPGGAARDPSVGEPDWNDGGAPSSAPALPGGGDPPAEQDPQQAAAPGGGDGRTRTPGP